MFFRPYHLITLSWLVLSANPLYAASLDHGINATFSQLIATHASVSTNQFNETKAALWQKYLNEVANLNELKSEFNNKALLFQNKKMRFSLDKMGAAPVGGYPLYIALHGGGSGPAQMNDSQWVDMQTYYKRSVTNGVYIATRGITDSWKLHSEDESYPLYDKLIEIAVLFENVNPDRVYIMGFSAGGDGVYQIVPRMPARFAAANMSAGHHNWITFDNLYNTPLLLQVGELDGAYKRNRVTAENNVALNQLQVQYGGGYTHQTFIHYNGYHNTWHDNDAARRDQTVMVDPVAWLDGNRETKTVNSNAIDWLNQYTRVSTPEKLVWDLAVSTKMRSYQTGAVLLKSNGDNTTKLAAPGALFYWLDASSSAVFPATAKLVVKAVKATNTIEVIEAQHIDQFKILLNPDLLDLAAPVKIVVAEKLIATVNVKQTLSIMARTLLERSDVNQIYDAEITLAYQPTTNSWQVMSS
jgi:poly(3-hydroxybutyrate) depolymerase